MDTCYLTVDPSKDYDDIIKSFYKSLVMGMTRYYVTVLQSFIWDEFGPFNYVKQTKMAIYSRYQKTHEINSGAFIANKDIYKIE